MLKSKVIILFSLSFFIVIVPLSRSRLRKGQAAIEFLMTYGWALLVIVVVIGAMVYLVGDPKGMAPDSCVIAPGISCEAFQVSASGSSVFVRMQNGLGSSITGNTVVSVENSNTRCDGQNATIVQAWGEGETIDVTIDCSGGSGSALAQGDRFNGELKVEYSTKGLVHSKGGNVITGIEP